MFRMGCAHPTDAGALPPHPRDISGQRKGGDACGTSPGKSMNPSPGTVIGVPACTVSPGSPIPVNRAFLPLASNIPAGGFPALLGRHGFR